MGTIKELLRAILSVVKSVIDDSKAFREQEKACPKPKPAQAPKPSIAPAANVDMTNAQRECACLARHIVKGLVDFPTHINIKPYSDSVAVIIDKFGNNEFSVRFYKKDPSKQITSSDFHVELERELNRRMESVQLGAIEAIDCAKVTLSHTQENLWCQYNDPCSPYYGNDYRYFKELQSAKRAYSSDFSINYSLLNTLCFYNLDDMGSYVVVYFTAGYNGGAVLC